jgi:hypothetical protein
MARARGTPVAAREGNRRGSRPVSRVLSWTAIPLGCASPHTSSDLPGNSAGHTCVPLFGLAPGGVYPAADVATSAVRSYRTISPLPAPRTALRRYVFCGTFRRLTPPRHYLAPCPMEPGLSSAPAGAAAARPTPEPRVLESRHNIQVVGAGSGTITWVGTRGARPGTRDLGLGTRDLVGSYPSCWPLIRTASW